MPVSSPDSPLRLLLILHLPPPVHGAALMGRHVRESERLNAAFDCRYVNLATASGLHDIGHLSPGKAVRFVRLLRQIRKAVRQHRPQWVYVTPNARGGAFLKDFLVVAMLRGMGCRVVAHYHNQGVRTNAGRWPYGWLYRRFFRGLRVILLSERLYDDVAQFVPREAVLICPNGIPPLPATAIPPAPLASEGGLPRLLFLSNLLRAKGIYELLDACQRLVAQGRDFRLDIVGGETAEMDAAQLQSAIAERGLERQACYRGTRYGADKQAMYGQADLFVFPSHVECFPLVVLEAMQQGLPCVATEVGGIPDIVADGQTGLLIPPRDAAALAEAIGTLLGDAPRRQAMGAAARQRYEQLFTLDRFEQRLTEILLQCFHSEP